MIKSCMGGAGVHLPLFSLPACPSFTTVATPSHRAPTFRSGGCGHSPGLGRLPTRSTSGDLRAERSRGTRAVNINTPPSAPSSRKRGALRHAELVGGGFTSSAGGSCKEGERCDCFSCNCCFYCLCTTVCVLLSVYYCLCTTVCVLLSVYSVRSVCTAKNRHEPINCL
jgi:hypothetical protein